MKVKMFYGHSGEVESKINDFLSQDTINLVDIKFSTNSNSFQYHVIVVYNEKV